MLLFGSRVFMGGRKNKEISPFCCTNLDTMCLKWSILWGGCTYSCLEQLLTIDAEFRFKRCWQERQGTTFAQVLGEYTKQVSGVSTANTGPDGGYHANRGIYDLRTPRLGHAVMLDSLNWFEYPPEPRGQAHSVSCEGMTFPLPLLRKQSSS